MASAESTDPYEYLDDIQRQYEANLKNFGTGGQATTTNKSKDSASLKPLILEDGDSSGSDDDEEDYA